MRLARLVVLLAAAACIAWPAGAQTRLPFDLSGTWHREPVPGALAAGGGYDAGWGPDFTAVVEGNSLKVFIPGPPRTGRVRMTQYTLDGIDAIEQWSAHCPNYNRLATNASWRGDTLVITETAMRGSCRNVHGLSLTMMPEAQASESLGPRADLQRVLHLSSPTEGVVNLETTRVGPDGSPQTTVTVYRKK